MKKASINYWVDLATGVAFLVCAVTGVLFLFPSVVHTAVGAAPTILFMPALWWHKVHDWSGVVMVAGTALHLALHAKWIANMTRKMFGAPAPAEANRAGRPRPVAQPARAATAAQAATCALTRSTPMAPRSTKMGSAARIVENHQGPTGS